MISSGIDYLDRLTGGLSMGDNVVWQISNGVPVEYFIRSLLSKSGDLSRSIVYVNFNYSPHTICKRFDDIYRNQNVTLIDAFTHGKGNSDAVFMDFYNHESDYDLSKIIRVENPRDIPSFIALMNEIQKENKNGSFYVFDSLTGMNELWKDERAVLDFFSFTCPKLYDLNTIAYWVYEKDAHSREFIAGLMHITQIVIAVSNTDSSYYEMRIQKLEDRSSPNLSGPHHFRIIDREIRFQDIKQDAFRFGNKVKELRKSAGITQAELASRLGMTPGAISQIENDIITPSLNTLVQMSSLFTRPLEYFISSGMNRSDDKGYAIFRKEEIKYGGARKVTIHTLSDEKSMEVKPYTVRMAGYEKVDGPILLHKGKEFISVLAGVLNLTINGEEQQFRKGDSILLHKSFIERWANPGKSDCEFLYILL